MLDPEGSVEFIPPSHFTDKMTGWREQRVCLEFAQSFTDQTSEWNLSLQTLSPQVLLIYHLHPEKGTGKQSSTFILQFLLRVRKASPLPEAPVQKPLCQASTNGIARRWFCRELRFFPVPLPTNMGMWISTGFEKKLWRHTALAWLSFTLY